MNTTTTGPAAAAPVGGLTTTELLLAAATAGPASQQTTEVPRPSALFDVALFAAGLFTLGVQLHVLGLAVFVTPKEMHDYRLFICAYTVSSPNIVTVNFWQWQSIQRKMFCSKFILLLNSEF
jgi:hypothetical protein